MSQHFFRRITLPCFRVNAENNASMRVRSAEQTPDPAMARTHSFINDEDSSDEEMPLAKRASSKTNGKAMKREASSDEDNVPLVSIIASVCQQSSSELR